MVLLNPKEALNGELAINGCNQWIQFCNKVVLEVSDVAREFAIDKSWRNCFLAGEQLCTRYLLQNSFQFILLKKIGKVLVKNLERFSGGNSTNLGRIIIFDKSINLLTPKIFDLRNFDLNTGCYVALNCILSCLKKLPIWFFMLSTESRVEKLLWPNIWAKKCETNNENRWNNRSGHMPSQSTSD